MVIPSLIQQKRDGHALRPAEWTELIAEYTAGRVPDYQMSALLMAVVWRGLDPGELAALTDAMLDSGDRLDFDGFDRPRVDKHSTGGVGDKVSLLLAPMVASCGVAVPMMSGRGSAIPAAPWTSSSRFPDFEPRSPCGRPERRSSASAAQCWGRHPRSPLPTSACMHSAT